VRNGRGRSVGSVVDGGAGVPAVTSKVVVFLLCKVKGRTRRMSFADEGSGRLLGSPKRGSLRRNSSARDVQEFT